VNWVKLQEQYPNCTMYSVVDLHSLTSEPKINPSELRNNTLEITVALMACGIDPKKSILFNQSKVSCHTELAWILNCITQMPALQSMHQFHEKSKKVENKQPTAGLFVYPVLMTADILIYKATDVPVGMDQFQHLNLAKDLALKFNNLYQPDYFPTPNPIYCT